MGQNRNRAVASATWYDMLTVFYRRIRH